MITQEKLKKIYDYNEHTGIFTRRISSGGRKVGEVAGSIKTEKNGYQRVIISINGKMHKAHRLAWLYMYGEFPTGIISHKDGNAVNNAINNLMDTTKKVNAINVLRRKTNTSGVTGVMWSKKYNKWQVEIQRHGINKYLGRYANKDEAIRIRKQAEKELGFGQAHGQDRHPFAALLGNSLKY